MRIDVADITKSRVVLVMYAPIRKFSRDKHNHLSNIIPVCAIKMIARVSTFERVTARLMDDSRSTIVLQ